jgi:pimeloyl-ACP methyl ester carboxylesterase
MMPNSMRIPGADGLSLNLIEWSREGVPMLLLHGFSNEAHIWDDFAPTVAPYYRVLAMDLRGHGDSDWHPEAAYDYEDHVGDIEAIISNLGFERLVIVAHSLGGRAAMLFGGRHPEKLAGLVIVDSAPELDRRGTTRITLDTSQNRNPSFASVAEYERMLVQLYPAATPTAIRRMAAHGVKQRDDGRWILKMDVAFRGVVGNQSEEIDMRALKERQERSRTEMWASLERISCPTLIVRGAASDVLSAEIADRMVEEALPQGKLAVIPQASHSVMTDNPEDFNREVGGFVLGE